MPPTMTMKVQTTRALPSLVHQHLQLHHILSATTTRLLMLLMVLLCCMLNSTCSERDFNFNDSQVPLLEPKDEPKHMPHQLDPYVAELSRCHYADSEIILSLVLRDHNWSATNENKKTKVLAKLSKFFAIPKEFIITESVGKHEMFVMQKEALRKGVNKCHKKRVLGRVNLVLGCGAKYFSMSGPIVKQISQQMKDGSIDSITGEHFGWWVIWHRTVESRAHRRRRQASEGSGEDEYDSYDYDDEDDEEIVESVTEIPVVPVQSQHSSHAHRHHHGDTSGNESKLNGIETINAASKIDEPSEKSTLSINKVDNKKIDEEIVESVSQLESVISKTIENTKHIKDVIVPTDVENEPVDEDIEKELDSGRILEELQNELIHKNDKTNSFANDSSSSSSSSSTTTSTTATTENSNLKLAQKPHVTLTTGNKNQDIISNVETIDQNYDDNLDVVDDDLDDLDIDKAYGLPAKMHNSIDTKIAPAFDVVIEAIESSTTPVTKLYDNTFNAHEHMNIAIASSTPPTTFDATTLKAIETTVTTLPPFTVYPIGTLPTTVITTTITPISQMPPVQSPYPPFSPIYDTSSSSSSSSSTSILHSSVPSTPSLLLPPSSSFSSTSSPSLSIFDVTMSPTSQTPSLAILTTTEQTKAQGSDYHEETQTLQPIIKIDENKQIDEIIKIEPANQNEMETIIETAESTTSSTFMDVTSTTTTTTRLFLPTEIANNDEKANVTSSENLEPLPNVTSLSSPTQTTPASDTITTLSNLSSPSISTELTTPTSSSTDYIEPHIENTPPMIKTRLPKLNVTAGKYFVSHVPDNIFFDNEDLTNLRLEFTDKDGHEMKQSSWVQFNADTREIYGLPIFDTPSRYFYYLTATDSGNETVTETVEIKVMQHRFVRSYNHEINITVKVNEKSMPYLDWQLKLIKGIANTLGDSSTDAIVVPEVRHLIQDPNTAVLAYFNETFSTSECPESELNDIVRRLDASRLNDLVQPILSIKSIMGQLIGTCIKVDTAATKPPTIAAKNLPPVPRNQVDRVNATVGHLLVYPVPPDTFFDANDNQLTLTLKTKEHRELNPRHWLQFDSKNQEFYGIPKSADIGTEEYLLVAEDSGGLTATDALVVVVNHAIKREFSVYFKAYLAIRHEQFNANLQRKFVESISELFGDKGTHYIQIRSVTTHHDSDGTIVNFYNTTLYKSHNRCPEEEIEAARSVYLMPDYSVRDRVKKTLGPELNLTNMQVITLGSCHPQTDITRHDFIPPKNDEPLLKSTFGDDYFYTFILPAAIIVIMIIIASIIACCLHRRRRKSGKMELGDEEERKSFRTKGIPVIFQDELDEKPEIGNKSPIILKDEKPPLLPPSYNTSNMNGDNDVDEYVPPPAVVVGGREGRGKSPATPSYRKPPPYVSP